MTDTTGAIRSPSSARVLHDLIDIAFARHPASVAAISGEQTATYAQLANGSRTWAAVLCGLGVQQGDRIMVAIEPGIDMLHLLYAASRLGAIFVPCNPRSTPYQLRGIKDDCSPSLVVVCDGPSEWDPVGLPTITTQDIRDRAETTVPIDRLGCVSPAHPVLLMYTSGSSARPKGVVCPHRNVLFSAQAIQNRLKYASSDVVYCCIPFSFDYGLYQHLLCAIAGACLWIEPSSQVGPLTYRRILDSRATVLPLLPPLADILVALSGRSPDVVTDLVRLVTNTGSHLSPIVAERIREVFPRAHIALMYGLTECKRATILAPDGDIQRPGSCGTALPGTDIWTVDKNGSPTDGVGELVVRGENVMAGYWNDRDLTDARFRLDRDGRRILFTGDIGTIIDGHFYFHGRDDDIFKMGGVRASTLELEAAVATLSGVASSAVVLNSDRYPVLFYSGSMDERALLTALRRVIGAMKCPRTCIKLANMPLTINGKIDRLALRSLT